MELKKATKKPNGKKKRNSTYQPTNEESDNSNDHSDSNDGNNGNDAMRTTGSAFGKNVTASTNPMPVWTLQLGFVATWGSTN
jgi:hypothetical protein